MRILITGASGLLGINLAVELAKRHTVFGTVNQNKLDPAVPFQVIQTDLLKQGAVEQALETSQPDWVIHCAALASLDLCDVDPIRAAQLNTELPYRLAEYVARGGARQRPIRLGHISTDSVFDGARGGYSEDDLPNPLGVYSKTKLDGERAVLAVDPSAVVARVNLFGWGISGKRSLAEFFFNNLAIGKPVMGFTDVYFCPILANDMADVLEKIFTHQLSGLFHLVGADCLTKYEFGVRIAQRFGFDESLIQPASVKDAGLKAVRSPNLTLRTDKLAKALGETLPGIEGGLERLYKLYQEGYPTWLRRLAIAD
jgi:dTDP-4-dehydrorhamnose reductase